LILLGGIGNDFGIKNFSTGKPYLKVVDSDSYLQEWRAKNHAPWSHGFWFTSGDLRGVFAEASLGRGQW